MHPSSMTLPSSLTEAASLSQFVAEVVDYAIFILEPKGYIASWNKGAQAINGYSAEEIVGKHFSCLYPDGDATSGRAERELARAEREGRFEEESWRRRKDGSLFWSGVVMTAVKDASGQLQGFVMVTRDLTLLKTAEENRRRLIEESAARAAAE